MSIRLFGFISILLLALSCQEQKQSTRELQDLRFKADHSLVLHEIQSMLQADQKIRHLQAYGSSDSSFMDSLVRVFAAKNQNLDSLLFRNDTLLVSTRFRDSVQLLMNRQDEQHTGRVIALIKEYGYPDSRRIDSTIHISPSLLLHHPSMKHKETLAGLLSEELQYGRLDTMSYEMFMWDLNGRKGLPQIRGMKVQKNNDGSTMITL